MRSYFPSEGICRGGGGRADPFPAVGVMPRSPPGPPPPYPITAARFLSLFDIGGEDDLFSSDLTDAELRERSEARAGGGGVGGHCRGLTGTVVKRKLIAPSQGGEPWGITGCWMPDSGGTLFFCSELLAPRF